MITSRTLSCIWGPSRAESSRGASSGLLVWDGCVCRCTYPFAWLADGLVSPLRRVTFFSDAKKVTKKRLPLHSALAARGFLRSGPVSRARRDGPSMAQHGSPGIPAGRLSKQNLRSACWAGPVGQKQDQKQKPKLRGQARLLQVLCRMTNTGLRRIQDHQVARLLMVRVRLKVEDVFPPTASPRLPATAPAIAARP